MSVYNFLYMQIVAGRQWYIELYNSVISDQLQGIYLAKGVDFCKLKPYFYVFAVIIVYEGLCMDTDSEFT